MITLRPSAERGRFDHGWLDTRHTFSFGDYRDPAHVRFRSLRVLNEDWVAPGEGFPPHPHEDMEILTWVLSGALRHGDSLGNGSVIRPGEIQRMSAGTGVVHSEANASATETVHLLQIWILPERRGLPPSYEQATVPPAETRGRLRRIAGPARGRGPGEVLVHQDAVVHAAVLGPGETAVHPLGKGRGAWVQVAGGEILCGGRRLVAGDGAAIEGEPEVRLEGVKEASILLFDLA